MSIYQNQAIWSKKLIKNGDVKKLSINELKYTGWSRDNDIYLGPVV